MSSEPIIISIDGFASTGKSTLAKKISNYLEYNYVDTGSIYRAITLFSINNNLFEFESIKLNLLKDALKESSFVKILAMMNIATGLIVAWILKQKRNHWSFL